MRGFFSWDRTSARGQRWDDDALPQAGEPFVRASQLVKLIAEKCVHAKEIKGVEEEVEERLKSAVRRGWIPEGLRE